MLYIILMETIFLDQSSSVQFTYLVTIAVILYLINFGLQLVNITCLRSDVILESWYLHQIYRPRVIYLICLDKSFFQKFRLRINIQLRLYCNESLEHPAISIWLKVTNIRHNFDLSLRNLIGRVFVLFLIRHVILQITQTLTTNCNYIVFGVFNPFLYFVQLLELYCTHI